MDLFHQTFGGEDGPALVCLHGLLGSSRNWNGVARGLADRFAVHTVDLPDHGQSPWTEVPSIGAYAGAVGDWLAATVGRPAVLVGHSLGGKVAMQLALAEPGLVAALVVVDIAPRDYRGHQVAAIDALLDLPLDGLANRREADERLQPRIGDWAFRQFLLTNLVREGEAYRWQPNLAGIRRHLDQLSANLPGPVRPFRGPTMVFFGGRSDFEVGRDLELFREPFPGAEFREFPDAGHNLHIEAGAAFADALRAWACEAVSTTESF